MEAEKQAKNKLSDELKEQMAIKEALFVRSSSFIAKKHPSTPLLSRSQRSRSFNEKEAVAGRRLCDSDTYRKRAMEMSKKRNSDWDRLKKASR